MKMRNTTVGLKIQSTELVKLTRRTETPSPGNGAISHLCFLHKPLYYAQTRPCRGEQFKTTYRPMLVDMHNRAVGRFWANVGIFIIPYPPAIAHKNKRIFPSFIPFFYLHKTVSMLLEKSAFF